MNKSLPISVVEGIKKYFSNNPSVLAVFLMGSSDQSKLRSDSDVDLGILPQDGVTISSQELLSMVGDLGYEFGFDFDLGILNSHNLIYSKEAIFKGIQIYNQDEEATKRRVNVLLSMYYHFQFERKEILNAYRI